MSVTRRSCHLIGVICNTHTDANDSHHSGWHRVIIHTDGSHSHGAVGIGYVIRDGQETYEGQASFEGNYTTMEAEFLALREAARDASDRVDPDEHLYFYTDCSGLVDKMEGPNECEEWDEKRQAFLRALAEAAPATRWSVSWVPRERNRDADALAHAARDSLTT